VLIVVGLFGGAFAAGGILITLEKGTYWGAVDTLFVVIFGFALIPGVSLVVSGLSGVGGRVRAGITLIIVGVTYALLAGNLTGKSWGYVVQVPIWEYVFAALIGGIPLLIGLALLAYGPVRRAFHRDPPHRTAPPSPAP